MQKNQDFYFVINQVMDFIVENKIRLVEIDLFGENTRHIAIDTKLGTSFNVLMEDRLYRPGELVNSMTVENFERTFRPGDILPIQKDILLKKDMPKVQERVGQKRIRQPNQIRGLDSFSMYACGTIRSDEDTLVVSFVAVYTVEFGIPPTTSVALKYSGTPYWLSRHISNAL